MIDLSTYHLLLCSLTHGITLNTCVHTRHTFRLLERFMDAHTRIPHMFTHTLTHAELAVNFLRE